MPSISKYIGYFVAQRLILEEYHIFIYGVDIDNKKTLIRVIPAGAGIEPEEIINQLRQ